MKKFGKKSMVSSGAKEAKFIPFKQTRKYLDWYSIAFDVGVSKKDKKKFIKEMENLYFNFNKTVTTAKAMDEYFVKERK